MLTPRKWWDKCRDHFFRPLTSSTSPTTNTVSEAPSALVFDLHIQLLGSTRYYSAEGSIPQLSGTRNNLLLAYFAQAKDQKIRRDKLLALFWPDVPQESARNSLNVAICHIRQHFRQFVRPAEKIIIHHQGSYQLNPDWIIRTDLQEFRQWIKLAREADYRQDTQAALRAYQRAVETYSGDFLELYPTDDWAYFLRDQLKERYLHALDRLGHLHLDQADYKQALYTFQQMVRQDPLSEKAHRSLMWCYAQEGQLSMAVRQYRKCEKILREEYELEPSPQTVSLYQQITEQRTSRHRA